MNYKKPSQNELILRHLINGSPLTAYQALNYFSCFRLAARIHDLEGKGHDIKKRTVKTGNGARVAEYYMIINTN